ncbi:MAG: hypothetical protein RMJ88_02735 [Thermogemmata sp.]|nr:hypothetical protein [Thermogemmata sp.]
MIYDMDCESVKNRADGGWIVINPRVASLLRSANLNTPDDYLRLPGVIVNGHPSRHVRKVYIPSVGWAYLKKQHCIAFKERVWNWLHNQRPLSSAAHEGCILFGLSKITNNIAEWLVYGENRRNEAFLLLAEEDDVIESIYFLQRQEYEKRSGVLNEFANSLSRILQAGFAASIVLKHVYISRHNNKLIFFDWASCVVKRQITLSDYLRVLIKLHISVPFNLVSWRERYRVLYHVLNPYLQSLPVHKRPSLASIARKIVRLADRPESLRTARQQLSSVHIPSHIYWLDEQAVCVTDEALRWWPAPPASPPIYGEPPGETEWITPSNDLACLLRGRYRFSIACVWRLLSNRAKITPDMQYARILMHLRRFNVPAPRLLAFGHRRITKRTVEWFFLSTPYMRPWIPTTADNYFLIGYFLKCLHNASCIVRCTKLHDVFGTYNGIISIKKIDAIKVIHRMTGTVMHNNLYHILQFYPIDFHKFIIDGYTTRNQYCNSNSQN